MTFLLDTSVILQAKNTYYSFRFCPAFWDLLEREGAKGTVLSIDAVLSELQDPDARNWAKGNEDFFVATDDTRVREIADWIQNQSRFKPAEIARFLSGADVRLVSHALANGCIVVTQEGSKRTGSKVAIPDVCHAFRVPCVNTFAVLEELKARFVLE